MAFGGRGPENAVEAEAGRAVRLAANSLDSLRPSFSGFSSSDDLGGKELLRLGSKRDCLVTNEQSFLLKKIIIQKLVTSKWIKCPDPFVQDSKLK